MEFARRASLSSSSRCHCLLWHLAPRQSLKRNNPHQPCRHRIKPPPKNTLASWQCAFGYNGSQPWESPRDNFCRAARGYSGADNLGGNGCGGKRASIVRCSFQSSTSTSLKDSATCWIWSTVNSRLGGSPSRTRTACTSIMPVQLRSSAGRGIERTCNRL